MAISEKLWEGKAKSTMMAIKGANADGVTLETTWMAQLKGMGKAMGWDGAITFTGMTMMALTGVGHSMGTGMINFMSGDMADCKRIRRRNGRNGQEQERWRLELYVYVS